MAIVDLLAVAPFYLAFIHLDLRVLRALRLFRVLKLTRYSRSLQMLASVLRAKRGELAVTLFAIVLALLMASSLIYYVERDHQPDKFESIPAAMWWGVATLSTVGYGDVYPITALGKLIGALVALLGIGLFALPAGILGSGFIEEIQRSRTKAICPHCGRSP